MQQMVRQAELVVAVNFHRRPPRIDFARVSAAPSRRLAFSARLRTRSKLARGLHPGYAVGLRFESPMPRPTILVTDMVDHAAEEAIGGGLRQFNAEQSGISDLRPLAVI